MNEYQLSKRLAEVASFVPAGSRLADIGSDHAYLPAYLVLQGKICTAIAGELNEGPLKLAQSQVDKLGLHSVLEVRHGDGLEVLASGEVDVVVIAGMGGALIVQILNNGLDKLTTVKRLILQPNVGAHFLRQWFMAHAWQLKAERLVKEDGKFYEILVAEQDDPALPYQGLTAEEIEKSLLMGPFLLQERNEAFCEKWQQELEKRGKICKELQQAQSTEHVDKIKQIEQEIMLIKEGISSCQCLDKQ